VIYHQHSIAIKLLGALLVAACPVAIAYGGSDDESKPATAKPASSLDEQLLKGLDNELLEGLDDKPADSGSPKRKRGTPTQDKSNPLDEELLGDLGGEDLGEPRKPKDPLVGIGQRMRAVESRLIEQQLDDQTRTMQQKILDDLSALVQECKKCQGGGNKPPSKSSKPSRGSQAGTNPGQAPLESPPRDSSDQLRERKTERDQRAGIVNARKESWGNLPQHARQQIPNNYTEEFLPKYELLLEKYFKRLGEEDLRQ
jgi:hypothetical protein